MCETAASDFASASNGITALMDLSLESNEVWETLLSSLMTQRNWVTENKGRKEGERENEER